MWNGAFPPYRVPTAAAARDPSLCAAAGHTQRADESIGALNSPVGSVWLPPPETISSDVLADVLVVDQRVGYLIHIWSSVMKSSGVT